MFVNKNDHIGFFPSKPDPEVTLGMEGKASLSQDVDRPNSLKLLLSDIERGSEREVYQLMILIGDLGGFLDGILFLPAIIMTAYNSKIFYTLSTTFFPVKHRHKARRQL